MMKWKKPKMKIVMNVELCRYLYACGKYAC